MSRVSAAFKDSDRLMVPTCPCCDSHIFEEFNVATVLWPVIKLRVPLDPDAKVVVWEYGTAEPLVDSSSTDGIEKPFRCCDCEEQFDLDELVGPRTKPEILPFTEGT